MLEPRGDGRLFHCPHIGICARLLECPPGRGAFSGLLIRDGPQPKNPQLTRRCAVPDSVFTLRGPAGSGMIAFTSVPV